MEIPTTTMPSFTSVLPEPWLVPKESGFGIDNIPFGVFSPWSSQSDSSEEFDRQVAVETRRIGCRIGDWIIDLHTLSKVINSPLFVNEANPGYIRQVQHALMQPTLNKFADLGPTVRKKFRHCLRTILSDLAIQDMANPLSIPGKCMVSAEHARMHLPFHIGDYTDFYAGIHHAVGVGKLFRPAGKALQDNYIHLPVGYHGRSSSVVCSGTPLRRPIGQIIAPTAAGASESQILTLPSRKLDYEVELGCFIGKGNAMGVSIPIESAPSHIFGYVLLNDWSARDIQAFEYVPLGPFNGKNFATSISPWVVTPEALEFAMGEGVPHPNSGHLQEYLQEERPSVLHATITTKLTKAGNTKEPLEPRVLSEVETGTGLLWSFPQMIAHHTLSGCPLRSGDLLGSGTISGPPPPSDSEATPRVNDMGPESRGSLLEITENGKLPVVWGDENSNDTKPTSFTFLEDGDIVRISATANYQGRKISFGEVTGRILPAIQPNRSLVQQQIESETIETAF